VETHRAEKLVRARALADKAYASHVTAVFEDCLEDDGSAITDAKKKKKIALTKEKNAAASKGIDGAVDKKMGLLGELVESHEVLAERYAATAKLTMEDLVPELESLTMQLREEVKSVEALGDAILEELEASEEEVVKAWEIYYNAATKPPASDTPVSSAAGTNTGSTTNSSSSSTNSTPKALPPPPNRHGASDQSTEMEVLEDLSDVWIFEMRYRMSVAFLSACWDKCSAELSRLFASMKEMECTRRYRLRELLITFMQKQEQLWVGLPSTIQPALKHLMDQPVDRKSIETSVQSNIRLRAGHIQRSDQDTKPAKLKSNLGILNASPENGTFELSSPLASDLLCRAKVIEKKSSGMISHWKTTLAIVTADSFLHLFDVPSQKRIQPGAAPETAFHALVPPVEIPTEKTIKLGAKIPKNWKEHLHPAESIALPNSIISFQNTEQNSAFEIVETVINQGAGKMWGKTWNKKFYLRTLSHQDTVDWIDCLKHPKQKLGASDDTTDEETPAIMSV